MGYNITIGKAIISTEYGLCLDVEGQEHPEAPNYPNDECSQKCNFRCPSYTTWHKVVRELDIEELFYDKEEGLFREHPGVVGLTKEHLEVITEAVKAYKVKYPDAKPAMGTTDEDSILLRGIWLEWWVRYSITNYGELAAIANG